MKRPAAPSFLVTILFFVLNGCSPSPSPAPTALAPTAITPTRPSSSPTPATTIPQGKSIVVNNADDSGPGTLRQALQNAEPGDIISFDPVVFSPTSPTTISLTSGLPELSRGSLMIDGSNAGVILQGNEITNPELQYGLHIISNNNTIRGLQIVGFPLAGIGLDRGASDNLIGGDRGIGAGPLGQGNLISGNGDFGIGVWGEGTSNNTIQGNYIGTNLDGTDNWGNARDSIHVNGASYNVITGNVIGGNGSGIYLCCVADGYNTVTSNTIGIDAGGEAPASDSFGVLVDQTGNNEIGPGNSIAFNAQGITFWENTPNNTVTQNSIHDNRGRGINVTGVGDVRKASPIIFEFDLQAGSVAGLACANCIVEVFSDRENEAAIYEGQTLADGRGLFTLSKGVAFSGPYLTTNATDPNGSTTEFSRHTSTASGTFSIQEDNALAKLRFQTYPSRELADNRIGAQFDSFRYGESYDLGIYVRGVTRARVAITGMEPDLVDWDVPEFSIDPSHDDVITRMADNGLTITYVLTFWDKLTYPGGEGAPCARFKTEGEIENYLEFVKFTVNHFKDRVRYFEIWNEPDIRRLCPKYIASADYINLVKRTVPVIRGEYPEAKIVVGGVSNLKFPRAYEYLFDLLESDIMPLVDVVSWHPMYGTSPQYDDYRDYYYGYADLVQDIKDVATANGFVGEYQADEIGWSTPENAVSGIPWVYSPIVAEKYYGRGILLHLGMDVGVGVPDDNSVVRNLTTTMVGAEPVNLPVQIQTTVTNLISYAFVLPNGDHLVALWNDGVAQEYDPGVATTITLPGFGDREVMGLDVLYGFEQELITESENGNLIIRNLLVKDYPTILRITSASAP